MEFMLHRILFFSHLLFLSNSKNCEEIPREEFTVTDEEIMAGVEECPIGAGDFNECTLKNLRLFSCYKLWLVVEGGYNKVRSLPVFVLPVNYGECSGLLL